MYISGIEKFSDANGDGFRTVVYASGCSHHCNGCQNPETWNVNSGILFDENVEKELFEELNKDYISGVTFSGGDPFHENNLNEVLRLVNKIRVLYPQKTIWLYTGYTWEEIWEATIDTPTKLKRRAIVNLIDVLVDGKYIDSQRDVTLKWRGSSNQRVISVQQSLQQNELVLHCD